MPPEMQRIVLFMCGVSFGLGLSILIQLLFRRIR
jgi:hypothetical protein